MRISTSKAGSLLLLTACLCTSAESAEAQLGGLRDRVRTRAQEAARGARTSAEGAATQQAADATSNLRIVFSNRPIRRGEPGGTTVFKPGEPIYGVVYLGDNTLEKSTRDGELVINYEIEGEGTAGIGFKVPPEKMQDNFFEFELLNPAQHNQGQIRVPYVTTFNNKMARQPAKQVSVRIFASFWSPAPTGDIKIDLTGAGGDFYKQAARRQEQADIASLMMPTPAKRDAALERQMLSVWTAATREPGVKAVITTPDWEIVRNQLTGVVMSRKIEANVASRLQDGSCGVRWVEYSQEYVGNSFGSLKVSDSQNPTPILCTNASR